MRFALSSVLLSSAFAAALIFGSALSFLPIETAIAQSTPPSPSSLLTDSEFNPVLPPADVIPLPGRELLVRERYVGINPAALDQNVLTLNLFDDMTFVATKRSRQNSQDGLLWLGTANGSAVSSITMSVDAGKLRGGFAIDGRFFTITPVDGSVHQVREIRQPITLGEGGQLPIDDSIPESVDSVQAQSVQALGAAGDPQIDVVILWTPNARTALANSTKPYTQIEEWVNYAFQVTNEAYAQSTSSGHQVGQRLRLVHAQEVNYTDALTNGFTSGIYIGDLNQGSDSGSGPLGIAKTLEETYKADLVAIIIDDSSGYAGVAYRPSNANSFTIGPNESVTRWDAIFPHYTFAHELGHNMGLHHDRAVASGSWQPYGYGYRSPSSVFRTVMAYNCQPNGCPRVGYFSNPDVTYALSNEIMGVDIGQNDQAHNAQALIDSANLVSDNRIAVYDIAIGDTFLDSSGNPDVFGEWGDTVGNEECISDQDGADDVAGIDDVSRHCVASNQVDQLYFLQSIDDVNVSAGDPTTVCTLIDTEPDLFINYALCTTIVNGAGTPNSTVQTTKLYSCDNSSTSGCGNATYSKDYEANRPASGGYYSDGVFYFGNNEAGPFGNDDSQLEIQVPYADLGGLSGVTDICTKMSTFGSTSTINGAPLDQVLRWNQYLQYNIATGSGTVTVDGCGGASIVRAELVSPLNNTPTSTPDFVFNAASNATDYTIVVYSPGSGQIVQSGTFSASICTNGVCTAQPGWTLAAESYLWLALPLENGMPLDWVIYSQ